MCTRQGGLLNFVIMKVVISAHRPILLDVQGTNIWSGQQVQSFNTAAVAWGALGKPLYATGSRYGVRLHYLYLMYSSSFLISLPQFVPYMLLVGLLVPIPTWYLHRRYPKVGFQHVFTPVLTGASFQNGLIPFSSIRSGARIPVRWH